MDVAECTCFELPPEMWTTHYGAVEPGSTHEPNPNCREHFRKPPTRLADGTWSDGVDRSKRIWSTYFAMTNNGRWHVYKGFADFFTGHEWRVYSDRGFLSYHKTHAEAIAYVDKHPRMARTNQGDNNE